MNQSMFLPSNGTVYTVTYDFQRKRLFYADVRSKNTKIAVIFPRNGTRRDIYLAGKFGNSSMQAKFLVNPFKSGIMKASHGILKAS